MNPNPVLADAAARVDRDAAANDGVADAHVRPHSAAITEANSATDHRTRLHDHLAPDLYVTPEKRAGADHGSISNGRGCVHERRGRMGASPTEPGIRVEGCGDLREGEPRSSDDQACRPLRDACRERLRDEERGRPGRDEGLSARSPFTKRQVSGARRVERRDIRDHHARGNAASDTLRPSGRSMASLDRQRGPGCRKNGDLPSRREGRAEVGSRERDQQT